MAEALKADCWNIDFSADGRSALIYTLRQEGWRKGEPILVNDTEVRVLAAPRSETEIRPIAAAVYEALALAPPAVGVAEPVKATAGGELARLVAIAKAASEGVAKNAGIAPQLAFAPILWALQDALLPPEPAGGEPVAWRYRSIDPIGGWLMTQHRPTNEAITDRPNVFEVQPLFAHPQPEQTGGEWRPIESAPKDGTTVLIYDDGAVTVAFFDEEWSDWFYPYKGGKTRWTGASHWMPVPSDPPPAALQQEVL
ncbi:MAG: hypothetical protein EON59_06790 [Alphaproteobacteria bacterium]|nr:MAG: hypothetical protein EON59_06790 [Alphaproteobacteria bacterium]